MYDARDEDLMIADAEDIATAHACLYDDGPAIGPEPFEDDLNDWETNMVYDDMFYEAEDAHLDAMYEDRFDYGDEY